MMKVSPLCGLNFQIKIFKFAKLGWVHYKLQRKELFYTKHLAKLAAFCRYVYI